MTDPMKVMIMMHWMVKVEDRMDAFPNNTIDVEVVLYCTNYLVTIEGASLSNPNLSSTM